MFANLFHPVLFTFLLHLQLQALVFFGCSDFLRWKLRCPRVMKFCTAFNSEIRLSPAFFQAEYRHLSRSNSIKKTIQLANFHFYRTRTARLRLSVVPVFSLRFCLKFNASACLNFPTVVATWLYSFQKRDLACFSHNIFRVRPVPSLSQSRVTFVKVFKHKFRSMLS